MTNDSLTLALKPTAESLSDRKGVPKLANVLTNRKSKKLWITPEDEIIPLRSWHYEFFRDPVTSRKYGVIFRDEENTRLDALRVGFVRVNYEVNGGVLTLETMRWDRKLRNLVNALVLENVDAIDMARTNLLANSGQMVQLGCVSLLDLRKYDRPINRFNLGSWNNHRVTKL